MWIVTDLMMAQVKQSFNFSHKCEEHNIVNTGYAIELRSNVNAVTLYLRCPCYTLHVFTIIITIHYAQLHASNPKLNPNPNPNTNNIVCICS